MSGGDPYETVTFGGPNVEYEIDIEAPTDIELGDSFDVAVTLSDLNGAGYVWIELAVNGSRLPDGTIPSQITPNEARNRHWGPFVAVKRLNNESTERHTFTIDTTDDRFYEVTKSEWGNPSWTEDDTITATSRRFDIVTAINSDGMRLYNTVWQNAASATTRVDLQEGRRIERHVDDVEQKARDALGEHADFSRTSWQQLKPVPRDDLTEGTRAEVYDPLWLLGRQWQVGEFDGEDAGSPVRAELFFDTDKFNEYDPEPGDPSVTPREYELSDGPLEAIVEREPVVTDDDGPGIEVAAEAGQYFLRLLDEHDYTVPDDDGRRPARAADFPEYTLSRPNEPLDAAGRRYTMVVDGRTVDGPGIYEAATTPGRDAPCPTAERAADADPEYQNALQAFTDWYADLYDEPSDDEPSPWTPDRMEYQFGIATGEEDSRTAFEASDYTGGRLDWYAFDVDRRDAASGDPTGEREVGGLAGIIAEMNAARNTLRAIAAAESRAFASDSEWQATPSTSEDESADAPQLETIDPLLLDRQVRGDTLIDVDTLDRGVRRDPTVPDPSGDTDEDISINIEDQHEAAIETLVEGIGRFDTTPGRRHLSDHVPDADVTPTKASYPGMPAPRFWEFEDGEMNLKQMKAGPGELGKTLMLEYATLYGNDWYQLDINVPLGSLVRVTGMTVTDTFGEVTAVPPTGNQTDRWGMFTFDDLPKHTNPGLLVPPVLSTHEESEPVEEVVFTRDEMANLAFGIETIVEDPIGDSLERIEFRLPAFELEAIEPNPDPTAEFVAFHNPGEDVIDVSSWQVVAEIAVEYTTDDGTESTTERRTVFEFPDRSEAAGPSEIQLQPDDALRIYSANPKGVDGSVDATIRHAGRSDPVWNVHHSADVSITVDGATLDRDRIENVAVSVVVEDADGNPTTIQPLATPVDPSLADYRLATDVEDYWFPMKPIIHTGDDWRPFEPSVDIVEEFADLLRFDVLDMRFELAQLVDADVATLPVPLGEILDVDDGNLRLYDEELTRAGLAVTRSYQRTRWVDGSTHLWSGRRTETGFGQLASDLQYDVLEVGEFPEIDSIE